MNGLAGLPLVAAKVLEDYFSGWEFSLRSVRSKPQAGLPSLQHHSWERSPGKIHVKNSRVSVFQGEMAGDAECLKWPMHKTLFAAFILGSGRGRAEWTR